MPHPSDVHVNAPLTDLSLAVIQSETAFIAAQVFPTVPVKKQGDRYYVYNAGDLLADDAKLRAPGTKAAEGDYRVDNTPAYYCPIYAKRRAISEQERDNADAVINTDRDAMEFVTRSLLIRRERLWVAGYFGTGIWTNNKVGGAKGGGKDFIQWSDYTNSHPITDVGAYMEVVRLGTGFRPNTLVLTPDVMEQLRNHPDVLDRFKYTQKGVITADLLAAVMGVERVVSAEAVYNSSLDPDNPVITNIAGTKAVLLVYAAKAPGIRVASGGYTFVWTGLTGVNSAGFRIKKYRVDELSSDIVEGEVAFAPKIVAPSLGCFLSDAIA
jgi:hypothetical protein